MSFNNGMYNTSFEHMEPHKKKEKKKISNSQWYVEELKSDRESKVSVACTVFEFMKWDVTWNITEYFAKKLIMDTDHV